MLIRDNIFVRITEESRNSIFEKEIVTSSGEKVKIATAIQATDDMDERASFLVVQAGIVEDVSPKVNWIKKGDIALLNYDVCNSKERLVYKDGEDCIYFVNVITTYHKEDEIAYQTQKSKRDQIVHQKGEYDELSPLLGIIQDGNLIANCPFIFLEHMSNVITMVAEGGTLYDKTDKILERKILAISKESEKKYGIKSGNIITVDDYDIFSIKIGEDYTIDCINDIDVLYK